MDKTTVNTNTTPQIEDKKPNNTEQNKPGAGSSPSDDSNQPIPPAQPVISTTQEESILAHEKNPEKSVKIKQKIHAPAEINEVEQEPPEESILPEDNKTITLKNKQIKQQNPISKVAQDKNFEQILEVGLSPALEEKVSGSHQKDKKKVLVSSEEKNNKIIDNAKKESIIISSEIKKAEKLKKTAAGAPNLLSPKATMRPEDSIDLPANNPDEKQTHVKAPDLLPEHQEPAPKQTKETIPNPLQKIIPEQPKVTNKREDKSPAMQPINYLSKLNEYRGNANRVRQDHVAENLLKILDFAQMHQKITNDDVERLTGVKDDMATIYLNKLIKQGKLVRFGNTKNTFYKPIKHR